MGSPGTPHPRSFPTTIWEHVRAAARDPDALDALLAVYRGPLVEYLRRSKRVRLDDAEDVVHQFVVQRVLGDGAMTGLLGRADAARGRFRSYLLTALDRFFIDCARAAGARKRGPGGAADPDWEGESADPEPGTAFDVALGLRLLGMAVGRLRRDCHRLGRADRWQVFEGRALALASVGAAVPFADLARQCGYATAGQAATAYQTALAQFHRHWRDVTAEHLGGDPEAEREALAAALRTAGRDLLADLQGYLLDELPGITLPGGRIWIRSDLADALADRPHAAAPGTALRAALAAPAWFETGDLAPAAAAGILAAAGDGGGDRRSFSDLFGHPAPGVGVLAAAKEYAKACRADADGPVPPEVATALYYAAIAAARVRHGANITAHPAAEVRAGLAWLAARPWADPATRALAAAALDRWH